jgi:hypothetical protein
MRDARCEMRDARCEMRNVKEATRNVNSSTARIIWCRVEDNLRRLRFIRKLDGTLLVMGPLFYSLLVRGAVFPPGIMVRELVCWRR